MSIKRIATVTAALALVLGLAACGSDDDSGGEGTPASVMEDEYGDEEYSEDEYADEEYSDDAPYADSEPDADSDPVDGLPGVAWFGETYKWEGVCSVKVEEVGSYDGTEGYGPMVEVTYTNLSEVPWDMSTPGLSGYMDGEDAEEIWDDEEGMEGNPGNLLQAGESASYETAFEGDADDQVFMVTVQPDFDHDAVVFGSEELGFDE